MPVLFALQAAIQGGKRPRGRELKPVPPSHADEIWYHRQLLAIVNAIWKTVNEEIDREYAMTGFDGAAFDAGKPRDLPAARLLVAIKRASVRFGGIGKQADTLALKAAQKAQKSVDTRFAKSLRHAVGVNVSGLLGADAALTTAMAHAIAENVSLITTIAPQFFDRLERVVQSAVTNGIRHEAIADELRAQYDITKRRANVIARDQISKMNGSFNQVRQKSAGITRYEWSTSGDERVRDEHRENDGKIFSWNDPPPTGHPGEDIMCRCVAIPIID